MVSEHGITQVHVHGCIGGRIGKQLIKLPPMPSADFGILNAWTDKGVFPFDINPKIPTDMKELPSNSWSKSTWIHIFPIDKHNWSSLKDKDRHRIRPHRQLVHRQRTLMRLSQIMMIA